MIQHDPFKQLHDLDRNSPQFHDQLSDFFRGDVYRSVFPDLGSEDSAWLVEYLDSLLVGIPNHASQIFQESLHELGKICGAKGVLPKSCRLSETPLGCTHKDIFNGSNARIRHVGIYPGGDLRSVKEAFHQAAAISKHLTHPNIVPLLGVTIDPLELVSELMPGGNLTEYITNNAGVDRCSLLSDVAEGLHYLHSLNVIHGDLKCANILVDATGRARITDFGLAAVTQNLDVRWDASTDHDQSARWIAPEILDNRETYSKEADIFSFAGITIEVFTGAAPFSDKAPHAARLAVTSGERPPRPAHLTLTDGIWSLIQRCWNQEPHLRPRPLKISYGFGVPAWKRMVEHPLASDDQISLITDIFSDRDEIEVVKRLYGDDAQCFVDMVDKTLDRLGTRLRRKCLSVLGEICGRQALLPRSQRIPLCYDRSDDPLYTGGFADVWMGEYQGSKVAVKVLRVLETSHFGKITSRFYKEVMTWRSLRHPNVLPLLGVTMSNSHFAMVSAWMTNGNINEFIMGHGNVNRFELLQDVTRGLIYIHDQAMVHGDLKGANILIDQNCHACLVDFGLLTFFLDPTNPTASNCIANAGGTTRWMSPELLYPQKFGFEDGRPTRESDYYAFGMVILEVLSAQAPFARYKDSIVTQKIVEGERPERPKMTWFTDDLWEILEKCWTSQPKDRPTAETIFESLERVSLATAIDSQQRLINRSFSQGELPYLLETVFGNWESTHVVQSLQGCNSQDFVDILDETSGTPNLPPRIRKECLRSLCDLCGRLALFPTSLKIGLHDVQTDDVLYRGGSANVLKHNHQGREVAVKALRISTTTDLQVLTYRFCKEFVLWNALRHPNLLPLIGVRMTDTEFTMVSEWMPLGSINQYVKEHQDVNRFELLSDVAKGLIYMHGQGMIHGDLKGGNILVDETCHARIADFGLTILSDSTIPNLGTQCGTIRWMSPELFDSEAQDCRPTKYSDCYALGMVVYEVLSLCPPFYQYRNLVITGMIIQGDRPERPGGVDRVWFTNDVWEVLEQCWIPEPRNRPSVKDVLRCLERSSTSWMPPSHGNATSSTDTRGAPPPSRITASRPGEQLYKGGLADIANANEGPPDTLQQGLPLGASISSLTRSKMLFGATTLDRTISIPIWLNIVVNWDGKSQDIYQVLTAAFGAKEYLNCIKNLQVWGIEPLSYIDGLDKIIDSLPVDSDLRKRCIRALRKTCGLYGALPTSHSIPFTLAKPGPRSIESGSFYDVWRIADEANPDRVFAVKSFRVYEQEPAENIYKKYCKEVIVHKRAVHPNIVPCEGVDPNLFKFCMVTHWMPNGQILSWIGKHPGVNRLELLIGVTRGLGYLHDSEVVHGNLASTNILVDLEGNPRLCDFSLCSIAEDINSVNASTPNCGGMIRYCAPELLDADGVVRPEEKKPTYKSDVYSLSMVIVGLVTGMMPFPESTDPQVAVMVGKGKRPQRPHNIDVPGITPGVWAVAERCWHKKVKRRPEVKTVLQNLEDTANLAPSTLKQIWCGIVD